MFRAQSDCLWRSLAFTGATEFVGLPYMIQPGDRAPALESKVRTTLGAAVAALNDRDKAEPMFRDAIRLAPAAARPKIGLARLPNEDHVALHIMRRLRVSHLLFWPRRRCHRLYFP